MPDERVGDTPADGDGAPAPAEAPAAELSAATPAPTVKRAGDRPPPVDPAAAPGRAEGDAQADRERALVRFGFDSVRESYTAYDEVDGPNWIEANRRVGEIGGWRTYARELFEVPPGAGEGEEPAGTGTERR